MKLDHYFLMYNIDIEDFAINKCRYVKNGRERHISIPSIYLYLRGKARPYQWTAEIIEKATNGLVTVKELRGKDDRENPPRRKPSSS